MPDVALAAFQFAKEQNCTIANNKVAFSIREISIVEKLICQSSNPVSGL